MKKNILVSVLLIIYIFGFIIISTVFAEGIEGFQTFSVPEPATLLLLGIGMVGLAGVGRKKIKK
jgi:purine-cytosine permease-like protein